MLTISKIGKIQAITALLYDFNIVQLEAIHDTLFKMRRMDIEKKESKKN